MLLGVFPLISVVLVPSMVQAIGTAKLGEPCEEQSDCELHLRCSDEGVCAELFTAGEACERSGECDIRLYQFCLDGVCNEKPGVGSSCNVNLDCDPRTSCVFSQCTNSTDLECSDTMNCTIDGLTCVSLESFQICTDKSVGSFCMNPGDCHSNICQELFCSEGNVGDFCSDDGECRQGNYCGPFSSCEDGSDGSSCEQDSQCINGTCLFLEEFKPSVCSGTKSILVVSVLISLALLVFPLATW